MILQDIKKNIDDIIQEEYADEIPGLTLLIGEKGSVFYKKAYGYYDIENKKTCTENTKFMIASITKQITCMAIMILKEKGLLDYDDNIKKHFKDLPDWIDGITIRHLMTHTSGIPDYCNKEFIHRFGRDKDCSIEIEDIIEMIKSLKPEFEAGTGHSYSNTGYVMLQKIIEEVSGVSFEDFVSKKIFIPAGMSDSLIPDAHEKIEKAAIGYDKTDEGKFQTALYNKAIIGWADGNVMSTVEDLFSWVNSLDANMFVCEDTLNEAYQSYILVNGRSTNYGFGHFISSENGRTEIWHTGGLEGFRSNLKRFIEDDLVVIMLTNISEDKRLLVDDLFKRISDLVLKNHI